MTTKKDRKIEEEYNELMRGYNNNNVENLSNINCQFSNFEYFSIYDDSSSAKNTFSNSNATIKRN